MNELTEAIYRVLIDAARSLLDDGEWEAGSGRLRVELPSERGGHIGFEQGMLQLIVRACDLSHDEHQAAVAYDVAYGLHPGELVLQNGGGSVGAPVGGSSEAQRVTARQLLVLKMLLLAREVDRVSSWPVAVRAATKYGSGLTPPIAVAEIEALRDTTIGELFGAAKPPWQRRQGTAAAEREEN